MSVKTIKIAIAGVGTVGQGFLDLLKTYNNPGLKIIISAIASRRKKKFSGKIFKNTKIFKDAKEIINFNNYDILVELIGGEKGIAKEIIFNALKKKKNVVTANKALVSNHWSKINSFQKIEGSSLKYEAAVAGGIPIIKTIEEFLLSSKIKRIYGILNGTSNYILTNMLSTDREFKDILLDAQKLGYAESDPTFDIDGTDSAQKLSILSSLAFSYNNKVKEIRNEGIQNIKLHDIKTAESLGYKIKLLGITELDKGCVKSFVYPCLLSSDSFIAKVDGVYNGVVVESTFCKKTFFVGEGAGAYPTATSVLSDIINLSQKESIKSGNKSNEYEGFSLENRFGSYYLRFITDDKPGVISGIANEFKKYNISMKSMLQKEPEHINSMNATIVITTHNCIEKNMMEALEKINRLKFIKEKTIYLRIENFR